MATLLPCRLPLLLGLVSPVELVEENDADADVDEDVEANDEENMDT